MSKFKTLDDLGDVRGKAVLVREDLNVPMAEGRVTDDTRLRAAMPTLLELADRGAKVLVLAHFGRPKGAPDEKYSLRQVVPALSAVLGRSVGFVAAGEFAPAIEQYDLALGLEDAHRLRGFALDQPCSWGAGDVDGGELITATCHLAGNETVPDQLIEFAFGCVAKRVDAGFRMGRTDGFVRFLRIRGLGRVDHRLRR